MVLQQFKNWMLPIAMITGGLFYPFFSQLAPVIPYLIFCMLLVPYCKISLMRIRIKPLHLFLILIQIIGGLGIYTALSLRPIGGARNLHMRTGPYGHFGRGHHRHAGRERRLAGHLQSAEQSLRRCTIPLDIHVYRRTRFDAVRTLLRDHLPSDDPLTDPAVRFGHAVEKVSSPCAPRNQKTAGTFVLHVVRRTGHRNRQHGLVPDAAGCIELPDRNDNGAACAGRMRFAVHHRTQDRAPFPRQSRRSAGSRTEKHDPCDLDGTDLPQSRFIGRPRFLCGVAEHREFLPVVAPAARQRLKTAIAVSCSRRV